MPEDKKDTVAKSRKVPTPKDVAARAARPADTHPGEHPVPVQRITSKPLKQFVSDEYNPHKKRTITRLGSLEEQMTGADTLLRVLAVKEMKNAESRAIVRGLQTDLESMKRAAAHLGALDGDDKIFQDLAAARKAELDRRFKKFFKAVENMLEPLEIEMALHARVIDDQNEQIGEVKEQVGSHEELLLIHDEKIEANEASASNTGIVVLIGLVLGIIVGIIAFCFKLANDIPNATSTETIRGVTVKTVHYSYFTGPWAALLVGLLIGMVVFVFALVIGFPIANRSSSRKEKSEEKAQTVVVTNDDSDTSDSTGSSRFDRLIHGKILKARPTPVEPPSDSTKELTTAPKASDEGDAKATADQAKDNIDRLEQIAEEQRHPVKVHA